MMVKQHFIETYGDPAFTIGDGGSGGSIQQLQIAQNYPGLLDGLSPELPFPDAISISGGVSDCTLLEPLVPGRRAPRSPRPSAPPSTVTPPTRPASCGRPASARRSGPTAAARPCPPTRSSTPPPTPRACAAPCRTATSTSSGIDPATGFAYRPLDNVGVQYGLRGAERRHHHRRPVPRPQPAGGRLRRQRQPGGGPHGGSHQGVRRTRTPRAGSTGRRAVERAHHPDQSLRRPARRHPRQLPQVHHPRPVDPARRHAGPEPAHLDRARSDRRRRARCPAGRRAQRRRHPDRAARPAGSPRPGPIPTRPGASAALAAARPAAAVDRCTDPRRHRGLGPDHLQGPQRLHPGLPGARRSPHRGRRSAAQRHAQVPAASRPPRPPTGWRSPRRSASAWPRSSRSGVCDWSKPGIGQVPVEGTWLDYGT